MLRIIQEVVRPAKVTQTRRQSGFTCLANGMYPADDSEVTSFTSSDRDVEEHNLSSFV